MPCTKANSYQVVNCGYSIMGILLSRQANTEISQPTPMYDHTSTNVCSNPLQTTCTNSQRPRSQVPTKYPPATHQLLLDDHYSHSCH